MTVPQLGQRQVAEAQILQFDDRLLAQEVVHPQDLVLVQHRMQPGVEFARRRQVVAEWLFHRDAGVLQQPGLAQALDNRREQRRRHFQVVQAVALRADPLGQRVVQRGVGDVAVQVGQPVRQPVEHLVVHFFAGVGDRLAGPVDQLLGA